MRYKLFYKSLLTLLLTSFSVVVLMIITMQFFVYRNFSDYVLQQELDSLDALAQGLSTSYQEEGNWDIFRRAPRIWHEMLNKYFPAGERLFPPPEIGVYKPRPEQGSGKNALEKRRPRPPLAPLRDFPGGRNDVNIRNVRHWNSQEMPPRRPMELSALARRLSLFDTNKRIVIGNPDLSGQVLKPIEIDSKVIGWLGLRKESRMMNPTDISFLKKQSQAFYVIGTIVLLMAVVVSVIFSRQLTAPVRKIAEGTNAIRNRRFDLRLPVTSNDELGQLADDFNAMAQALQSHESIRRQWLSDIAHELRTPLAVLRGEIEALQDGIRKVEAQTLSSLHGEVMALSKIVDDLSLIARTESGILEMRREVVAPLQILDAVMRRFAVRFKDNQIAIHRNFPDTDHLTLMGDADKLSQVFSNIFENALRYASSSEALTVKCRETKDSIGISIEDTGPGVPDESLDRIFDRLYRTDSARTREKGGAGLGLSICKTIIEAHQGKIWAENVVSGGLRIVMELPKHRQRS